MEEYNLAPLWNQILSIYEVIRVVCERHSLRFWVTGGSLLGTVRHQGFIPWDDDMDIMMPLEDYERFVQIATRELPEHLKVVNSQNTCEYNLAFGKVQETRREVVEQVEQALGRPLMHGIYVDIFPYCGMADLTLFQKFQCFYYRLRECAHQNIHTTLKSKLAYSIGRVVCFLIPGPDTHQEFDALKRLFQHLRKFDEASRVNQFDWSLYAYYDGGARDRWQGFKREWFQSTEYLPFCNTTVPVPNGKHEWLVALFGGDYMTPPPPEKRVLKHGEEYLAPWKFGPTGTQSTEGCV